MIKLHEFDMEKYKFVHRSIKLHRLRLKGTIEFLPYALFELSRLFVDQVRYK